MKTPSRRILSHPALLALTTLALCNDSIVPVFPVMVRVAVVIGFVLRSTLQSVPFKESQPNG